MDASEEGVRDQNNMPTEGPEQEELDVGGSSRLLHGWRLRSVTLSIALAMFLVNIEVSIVATSLVSIVNDLQGFDRSGWVVTSYLITYTSLIIIWSKFSNAFGRKTCMICTLFIFVAFSGGCGGSQSMTQLIICRALQGIGAAGCVSLGLTIAYEMVPQNDYPKYAAILSSVSALGSLVGPLIGGAFSERVSWRWIFLINIPLGLVVCILLLVSIPNGFPYQGRETSHSTPGFGDSPLASMRSLDILGAFCLLGASLLLVTALLEAGVTFNWRSAPTISLFTLSGILWIAFVLQEYRLSRSKLKITEPIFPWEFFMNRAWMGTLLLSMFSGAPYIVAIIDIPQRFQTFGVGAFGAGARLIPFNLLIALGAVVVNIIAGKSRIPPIFLLLIGVVFQITGVCLLSSITNTNSVPNAIYAYQILTGLGIGIMFGLCLVLPPAVINSKDFALCAGAVLQFRVFGGALGLAVASTVWNNYAATRLQHLLPPDQLALVLKSTGAISLLPEPVRHRVIEILVHSYNQRMRVLIGFTAAQLIALGMLWRRPQISLAHNDSTLNDLDLAGNTSEKASSPTRTG